VRIDRDIVDSDVCVRRAREIDLESLRCLDQAIQIRVVRFGVWSHQELTLRAAPGGMTGD
jgi:hypothetical protein